MRFVFHQNQLLMAYDPHKLSFGESAEVRNGFPADSYVWDMWDSGWYRINGPTASTRIDPSEVPTVYRTLLLLLT